MKLRLRLPESLDYEEREKLLTKAKTGCKESRERLIGSYLCSAVILGARFSNAKRPEEKSEFISVALSSVPQAVDSLIAGKSKFPNGPIARIRGAVLNARKEEHKTRHRTRFNNDKHILMDVHGPESIFELRELRSFIESCAESDKERSILALFVKGFTIEEVSQGLSIDRREIRKIRDAIRIRFIERYSV